MSKLRVLDLFSGIGGFSLGLERAGGFETVAFCEIDPFCREVLAKHWPKVRQYDDVRALTADTLSRDGITVDVICGGFPCQDISVAGNGAGIEGARSGLWSEYARLVGELRPQFIIVENVAALLGRGLQRVLGDLAALRFDAEWHCISASAVGAPHRRDRLWLVAYPNGQRHDGNHGIPPAEGREFQHEPCRHSRASGAAPIALAYADRTRLEGRTEAIRTQREWRSYTGHIGACLSRTRRDGGWAIEPDVGRVAHGVPSRVDRLRALGNAVVPQIPELIGRALMSVTQSQKSGESA